jgi:hypothetical protein
MSSPRPNLFLIGSMKSGTTYLSELLAQHPAIFMSTPKEPCHFVDGRALRREWPNMWRRGFWRSADRYLSLFADAGEAPVIGEASTLYSHAPIVTGVPERILAFNPHARFIYLLRDPVDRSISHYWHSVTWWGERRAMLTAMRCDPRYTHVSHYSRQLQEYLRHVGMNRIHVLTYEALLADPIGQLSDIYAWLGVNPTFRAPGVGIASNSRALTVYQVRGWGLLEKFRRSSLYQSVARHVPAVARRVGYKLAVRGVRPAEVPIDAVQAYLRSQQLRQTEELGELLQRTFPEWRTLYRKAEPVYARALS